VAEDQPFSLGLLPLPGRLVGGVAEEIRAHQTCDALVPGQEGPEAAAMGREAEGPVEQVVALVDCIMRIRWRINGVDEADDFVVRRIHRTTRDPQGMQNSQNHDPASLAASQDDEGGAAATAAELRRRIRDVEVKIANLVASIEAGIDPMMIAPPIAARTAERNELQSRLRTPTSAKRASGQQIQDEVNFFGGIAPMLARATPGELLEI
jgi:hypothetical protein